MEVVGLVVGFVLLAQLLLSSERQGGRGASSRGGTPPPASQGGVVARNTAAEEAAIDQEITNEQILENASKDWTYGADLTQPDLWDVRVPMAMPIVLQPTSVTSSKFDTPINQGGETWEQIEQDHWNTAAQIGGWNADQGADFQERMKQLIYEQLYRPASHVSPDQLSPSDITMALRLLWGYYSQNACHHVSALDSAQSGAGYEAGIEIQDYCSMLFNKSAVGLATAKLDTDRANEQIVESAVTGIAKAIPYVGSSLSQLGGTAVQAGYGSELSGDASAVATARATQFQANAIQNLRAFIGPLREMSYDKIAAEALSGQQVDLSLYDGAERPIVAKNAPQPFFIRAMLLSHGLWCSDQIGCGTALGNKIISRAKVFRALDLIGSQMFPDMGPRTGQYAYLYDYNTKYGPVFGSIFPPPTIAVSAGAQPNKAALGASLLSSLGIH